MTEKTIIRQLFYGELHPWERFVPNDSDLRKASNRVGKLVEEWKEHHSPDEAGQLQEIVDALYQYSSIIEADGFESGFRLGAKMMLDILQPDSNVVIPEKKL